MNIITVYQKWPTKESCLKHLEVVRWNGEPICPYCNSKRATPIKGESRYKCTRCNTNFSVTVNTIFHNTKLDLQKWFFAISLVLNAKKGLSARQLGRDLAVTKDTAWFMAMRIRKSMEDQGELLKGLIEMDETYIGGKRRRYDPPTKRGRGTKKPAVVGMMERGGRVVAKVVRRPVNAKNLMQLVRGHVDLDQSILMTDEFKAYTPMKNILPHFTINHSHSYVRDDFWTNSIEGFWALLKRGITGQYHKVSLEYLQGYINEFAYRFSNRKNEDIFEMTLLRAVGG
jgi:transposase-like protein